MSSVPCRRPYHFPPHKYPTYRHVRRRRPRPSRRGATRRHRGPLRRLRSDDVQRSTALAQAFAPAVSPAFRKLNAPLARITSRYWPPPPAPPPPSPLRVPPAPLRPPPTSLFEPPPPPAPAGEEMDAAAATKSIGGGICAWEFACSVHTKL
eukprot:gene32986-biopygen17033